MGEEHKDELRAILESGFAHVVSRFDSLDNRVDTIQLAFQQQGVRIGMVEARCELHQRGAALRDRHISEIRAALGEYKEDGYTLDTEVRTTWRVLRWAAVVILSLLGAFASATVIVKFLNT